MTSFRFYVGTHASSGMPSIHKCEVDFDKMTFTPLYSMQGISDPTYLAGPKDSILYALGRSDGGGTVNALKEDSHGLAIMNTLLSEGQGPCHICVDPDREFLLCANYGSGSISLFDLSSDGSLQSLCDFRQYSGEGFDSEDRQKGPHAHYAAFHPIGIKASAMPAAGKAIEQSAEHKTLRQQAEFEASAIPATGNQPAWDEVLVCDLGLDTVYVYEFDRKSRKLANTTRNIHLPAGSGPRHLAFHDAHPGMLYVLTEMANTIFVYEYKEEYSDNGGNECCDARRDAGTNECGKSEILPDSQSKQMGGQYICVQVISAVPSGSESNEICDSDPALMQPSTADNGSIGCAIRFTADGEFLFVSSRLGYQSISAFHCGTDGRLRFCSRSLCGGITPRDFNVFEEADSLKTVKQDPAALSETPDSRICHLLVANQDSDLITALQFDRASEELSLLDMKMQAFKPTCILPDIRHE